MLILIKQKKLSNLNKLSCLNFSVDLNNKSRYINKMKNNKIDKEIDNFYNNLNMLLKDIKSEVDRCKKILENNNYNSKKLNNIYLKEEVDYIYKVVSFEDIVIDNIKENLGVYEE